MFGKTFARAGYTGAISARNGDSHHLIGALFVPWLQLVATPRNRKRRAHRHIRSGPCGRFGLGPCPVDRALIDAEGRRYDVQDRTMKNPDDLPKPEYAVAWTSGPRVAGPSQRAPEKG
jgi:hypothetical protein